MILGHHRDFLAAGSGSVHPFNSLTKEFIVVSCASSRQTRAERPPWFPQQSLGGCPDETSSLLAAELAGAGLGPARGPRTGLRDAGPGAGAGGGIGRGG